MVGSTHLPAAVSKRSTRTEASPRLAASTGRLVATDTTMRPASAPAPAAADTPTAWKAGRRGFEVGGEGQVGHRLHRGQQRADAVVDGAVELDPLGRRADRREVEHGEEQRGVVGAAPQPGQIGGRVEDEVEQAFARVGGRRRAGGDVADRQAGAVGRAASRHSR
jgi:hypothetical protein